MTKKEKAMLYKHMSAEAVSINQIYNSPSKAKVIAAMWCEKTYYEMHGYDERYHSQTNQRFTFSFKYREGRREYLYYDTGISTYKFIIGDIDDKGRVWPCL